MRKGKFSPVVAAALAVVVLLSLAVMASAGGSATVLGYQVDLVGFTDNGNNTSTWTYAVTVNGDEPKQALSHWTLGIGACYQPILSPANNSNYKTLTTGFGCGSQYNCEESMCKVVYGKDPTTGIYGIKFEDCTPQLDNEAPLPRTHIFQFTVNGVPSQGGDVPVGVKPGNQVATGTVTGPQCGPNAVSMQKLTASPAAITPLALGAVVAMLGLIGLVVVGRSARA